MINAPSVHGHICHDILFHSLFFSPNLFFISLLLRVLFTYATSSLNSPLMRFLFLLLYSLSNCLPLPLPLSFPSWYLRRRMYLAADPKQKEKKAASISIQRAAQAYLFRVKSRDARAVSRIAWEHIADVALRLKKVSPYVFSFCISFSLSFLHLFVSLSIPLFISLSCQ